MNIKLSFVLYPNPKKFKNTETSEKPKMLKIANKFRRMNLNWIFLNLMIFRTNKFFKNIYTCYKANNFKLNNFFSLVPVSGYNKKIIQYYRTILAQKWPKNYKRGNK